MAGTNSTITIGTEACDELHNRLAAIDAHIDTLAMLAATGDVEGLKAHSLSTALFNVGEQIEELKAYLQHIVKSSATGHALEAANG